MSRVLCLVCVVALLSGACSSPAPKPTPPPTPASQPASRPAQKPAPPRAVPREVAAERARQFIGELAAGKHDKARAMMTARMKQAMPTAKLQQLWLILQAKLGFFEGLGKMRFTIKGRPTWCG